MIDLTELKKEKIKSRVNNTINIGKSKYYVKRNYSDLDYSEIIAYRLAKELGINCVPYEAVLIKGELYYLSKYIEPSLTGAYFALNYDMPLSFHISIYDIWDTIDKHFENTFELMEDVIKIFLFDIMFLHYDRSPMNWLYVSNEKRIYMLDNEFIFVPEYLDRVYKMFVCPMEEESNYDNRLEDLARFLEVSSREYIIEFKNMLLKITPDRLEEIIDNISSEYRATIPKRDLYLRKYKEHYEKMMELVNTKTIGRTRKK